MSAAAWPAFVLLSPSQPRKVLALLVNDDVDFGVTPGAALACWRRYDRAIAPMGKSCVSMVGLNESQAMIKCLTQ